MESETDARIPTVTQYTHSVKISDTQKGIRLDVHVWANSRDIAVCQAFETYTQARQMAIDDGITLAPVEVSK